MRSIPIFYFTYRWNELRSVSVSFICVQMPIKWCKKRIVCFKIWIRALIIFDHSKAIMTFFGEISSKLASIYECMFFLHMFVFLPYHYTLCCSECIFMYAHFPTLTLTITLYKQGAYTKQKQNESTKCKCLQKYHLSAFKCVLSERDRERETVKTKHQLRWQHTPAIEEQKMHTMKWNLD